MQVGGGLLFAKFSRDDEAQADAAGVEELVRAGINPTGMPEMFEKLIAERRSAPSDGRCSFSRTTRSRKTACRIRETISRSTIR